MSNDLWLNNPSILLNQNKITELWPLSSMILEEKINAITRLIILITLIGYFITMRLNIVLIGMLAIFAIVILYKIKNKKENFISNLKNNISDTDFNYYLNKDSFDKPKLNNPLMNVLIPDINYNKNKKQAAPTYNVEVEKQINNDVKTFVSEQFNDDKIKNKLFDNLYDNFLFDRSMINFNANPSTTTPNDQKSFQDYLYGDMISGKEGNPLALERNQSGAYNYKL